MVVAADGSGDYRSIQAALDDVPVDHPRRVTVRVRNGLYEEKVRVDHDRLTIIGESRDGVRVQFHAPRSEYDRRYDRIGPAVLNVFGADVIVRNMTIENTQTSSEHAFAIYGQPQRFILDDCSLLGVGGDTVSLWNTAYGMYYHRNCRFTGGVDFVCPRGWCFVRDCQFESASRSAAIWHDGHMDLDMKFVLRDCSFDGPEDFWLGRNHYPSQFYLLGCRFSENMADKPIGVVKDLSGLSHKEGYDRKYFYDCHREGGDYPWHADNLDTAEGSPSPREVTPRWAFDGEWDPESTEPPEVTAVETDGQLVHVYFSECVGGATGVRVRRADGSVAEYVGGDGSRRLEFRGGAGAAPERLEVRDDVILGAVATLQPRRVDSQGLPDASPRRRLTIALAGDSTVASYPADHPSQGWGWALGQLLDDRVNVVNLARGGRSSMSFRAEGWWDKVLAAEPDYVLIQFGHNDNPGKGPDRETDPAPGGSFRDNLRRYVEEARAAGATPVLISPTTRRFYVAPDLIDPDEKNVPYAEAALAVAEETSCLAVDLNKRTRQLFQRLGEESSDWIQPDGDRTHFTPAGAQRVAAVMLEELVRAVPALERHVLPGALWSY